MIVNRGSRTVPPPKYESRKAPTETADQALEAIIETSFKGKENISVNEFKGFLGTIQNWICSANDYDIGSKKAAIGNIQDDKGNVTGGNIIGLMSKIAASNPAVAAILEERKTTAWIDEGIKTIGTTLTDVAEGYENLKHLSITDKVLQMGLTDKSSSEVAKILSNSLTDKQSPIKFTGDNNKYTEKEQKAVLYTIIEESVKAANAESNPDKKASVLEKTLKQALGQNAFKFSEDFIKKSAAEIDKNLGLIDSINQGQADMKLIKFITGDINSVKERLAEVPDGEKSLEQKWTELNGKLSPEEINKVKAETDAFIARLQELVKTDKNYKLGTEEGELNIKSEIQRFKAKYKVPENASETDKAKAKAEAHSTYFDLVTNKAAETNETKKDIGNILNGSGLGDLLGQGIAAIVLFTAFKALTTGNSHVANGLGMQPHGGGGFMKKALGLVFMATVMNSTGLLTGNNDEKTATTAGSTQKTEQERPANNIASFARQAAGNLPGV
ncbi:MAG: hypothetical protein ACKO3R_10785 [bacterium]